MVNLFTIYNKNTTDYPGVMVMRRWEVFGTPRNPRMVPKEVVGTGNSLPEMRAKLPAGCQNLGRYQGEDPNIIESWMQRETDEKDQ